MNKFKLYFVLLLATIGMVSCHKNDGVAPPRDRSQQYALDNDSIESYLKHHYIKEVTTVNGLPEVEFDSITDPTKQVSIWDNQQYPLQHKIVKNDSRVTNNVDGASTDTIHYKLYYLIFKEGGGGSKPTTIDSTYTTYKGWTLADEVFDYTDSPFWSTFPQATGGATSLISGYRQFLPELQAAISTSTNPDGSVNYNDPGMGVVFIPSGLGYFNTAKPMIPEYSPLVFRIRLHAMRYRDHDLDSVLSKDEDLNKDFDPFNDDTDGDNIPNFLDIDDDGDGYASLFEIQNQSQASCFNGTTPIYLDKNCHPPKKQ